MCGRSFSHWATRSSEKHSVRTAQRHSIPPPALDSSLVEVAGSDGGGSRQRSEVTSEILARSETSVRASTLRHAARVSTRVGVSTAIPRRGRTRQLGQWGGSAVGRGIGGRVHIERRTTVTKRRSTVSARGCTPAASQFCPFTRRVNIPSSSR